MKKEYIVVSIKGVEVSSIDADLLSNNSPEPHIPTESVKVANLRPSNKRCSNYFLTKEEAKLLKEDPRILAVDYVEEMVVEPYTEYKGNFFRSQLYNSKPEDKIGRRYWYSGYSGNGVLDPDKSFINWGIHRTSLTANAPQLWGTEIDNPLYTPGSEIDYQINAKIDAGDLGWNPDNSITYGLDGTGVDIVIMDTAMQVDHPEFLDHEGNSRVQQITWSDYSADYTTDPSGLYANAVERDHGTHVASIAAGLKHGHAPGAHIFSMPCIGTEGLISVPTAFDLIHDWHVTKNTAGHPLYTGRPTVVNMSWGYIAGASPYPKSVTFRGTTTTFSHTTIDRFDENGPNEPELFDRFAIGPYKSISSSNSIPCPKEYASVDADLERLLDAGIVCTIAAGNDGNFQVKNSSDLDYNNSFIASDDDDNTPLFYNRPNSPHSENAITVGNLSAAMVEEGGNYYDVIQGSSCIGSRVDIFAPGTEVLAATSSIDELDVTTRRTYTYSNDTIDRFKTKTLTGTSMAAPQVAGIAALHLQSRPNFSPAQVKARILADASTPDIYTEEFTQVVRNDSRLPGRVPHAPITPTLFGKGSSNNTLHPLSDSIGIRSVTTGKVLYNRYANKKALELRDATITETTAQIAKPDYITHSVIDTNGVSSVEGYPLNNITAFIRIKSSATEFATKSVGDIKVSVTNANKVGLPTDLGNGTYKLEITPSTVLSGTVPMTISASLREHNSSVYNTLPNTNTVTITALSGSIARGGRKSYQYTPYKKWQYANPDFGIPTFIHLFKPEDLYGTGTTLGNINNTSDSILQAVEPHNTFFNVIDNFNGAYLWDTPNPSVDGSYSFSYKFPHSDVIEDMTWQSNFLPNQSFEANSTFTPFPRVVPADGIARQQYRVTPINNDGTPSQYHVGIPNFRIDNRLQIVAIQERILTGQEGDPIRFTVQEGIYHSAENAEGDVVPFSDANSVVHFIEGTSTEAFTGTATVSSYPRSQGTVLFNDAQYGNIVNNTCQINFSTSPDVALAFYSSLKITNPLTAINDGFTTIVVTLKDGHNNFVVDNTKSIKLTTNATGSTEYLAPYSPQLSSDGLASRYTVNIPTTALLNLVIEGELEGFEMKNRTGATFSGSNFTLFSLLSVDPEIIHGSQSATVTLQVKGDADTNITESVGEVTMSTSDSSTVTNIVDNNDGTYTATYNPLNTTNQQKTSIISATINGAPVQNTVTITSGESNFYKHSTLEITGSTTINQFSVMEVLCRVRRSNGNLYPFSVGNVQIQTTLGSISETEDLGNGTYRAYLRTNNATGFATLSASIHGFTTTDTKTATLLSVSANHETHSTVLSSVPSILANGEDHATITVTLNRSSSIAETTSLGRISIVPDTGQIVGDIIDNANGTYTCRYEGPLSLATLQPNFSIDLLEQDDISFTRTGVLQTVGVPKVEQVYNVTLGQEAGLNPPDSMRIGASFNNDNLVLPVEKRGRYTVPANEMDYGLFDTVQYLPLPGFYMTFCAIFNPLNSSFGRGTVNKYGRPEVLEIGLSSEMHDGNRVLFTETSNANFNSVQINDRDPIPVTEFSIQPNGTAVYIRFQNIISESWSNTEKGINIPMDANVGDNMTVTFKNTDTLNIGYSVHSTIEASKATVTANNSDSAIITVRLKTSSTDFATVSGGPVVMTTTRGIISNVTDNQDGTYTGTLTGTTDGSAVISATINGNLINDTATVVFQNASIDPSEYLAHSEIVVQPDPTVDGIVNTFMAFGDNTTRTRYQVIIKDSNDQRVTSSIGAITVVAGGNIQLSDIVDNQDGSYHFFVEPMHHRDFVRQDGHNNDVVDITASIDGQQIVEVAHYTILDPQWHSQSTVSLDPSTITVFETSEVTITARRNDGVAATASAGTITIPAYLGTVGQIPTVSSIVDNNNGTYTATITPGSTAYSSLSVVPVIDGQVFTNQGTLLIEAGSASLRQHSVISSQQESLLANAASQTTIELQLRSAPGVDFTTGAGTVVFSASSGTVGAVTNHGDGTYTAVYTSSTSAGTATISATLDGVAITDTHSITLTAGSFSEQFVVTTGVLPFTPEDYTGFFYSSNTGVYTMGSVDDNTFAPATGYHVAYIYTVPMDSNGRKYAVQMGLSDTPVGGSSSTVPSNETQTSWTSMRVGTTTYNRTDSSHVSASAGVVSYTWNIENPNGLTNPWGSSVANLTVTVTFDPSN